MGLSSEWVRGLDDPWSRKVMLLTISFNRDAPGQFPDKHLAEIAGTLRAATDTNVHVEDDSGRVHFFKNDIMGWPSVKRSWSPHQRRAAVTTAQVVVSGDAGIPDWIEAYSGRVAGLARLDLWTDGVGLSQTLERCAGPLRLLRHDRTEGSYTFEIEDGDLNTAPKATPGKIDTLEFPGAQLGVAGVADRQLVIGPYPDHLPLWPIDEAARLFYAHELPATQAPLRMEIGGTLITVPFTSVVGVTAYSGTPYQAYLFEKSPYSTAGVGQLTASFGVGVDTGASPILTLLEDLGGYQLTSAARALLSRQDIAQRVYVGSEAGVLALVRDRVMPQTDCVLAWKGAKIDVIRMASPRGQVRLGIGRGLRERKSLSSPFTDRESVFNVIKVAWGRDASSPTGTTNGRAVQVDLTYGGVLGSLLDASERRYGRRELPIQAPDLDSEADAWALAEDIARLVAFEHGQHLYSAEWAEGLRVEQNTRVLLCDDREGLDDKPTRVVEIEDSPTGPLLLLQNEDQGEDDRPFI